MSHAARYVDEYERQAMASHRPFSMAPQGYSDTHAMSYVNADPSTSFMGGAGSSYATREYTAEQLTQLRHTLSKGLGPEFVNQRPGSGNGPKVTYIEGWKAINLANDVFGFNGWSTQVVSLQVDFCDESQGKFTVGVTCINRIILRDGTFHEDVGYGSSENQPKKVQAIETAKKGAVTDAMKRCLRYFGHIFGNCLYDKEFSKQIVRLQNKGMPTTPFSVDQLHRHPDFDPAFQATKPPPGACRPHPLLPSTGGTSAPVQQYQAPQPAPAPAARPANPAAASARMQAIQAAAASAVEPGKPSVRSMGPPRSNVPLAQSAAGPSTGPVQGMGQVAGLSAIGVAGGSGGDEQTYDEDFDVVFEDLAVPEETGFFDETDTSTMDVKMDYAGAQHNEQTTRMAATKKAEQEAPRQPIPAKAAASSDQLDAAARRRQAMLAQLSPVKGDRSPDKSIRQEQGGDRRQSGGKQYSPKENAGTGQGMERATSAIDKLGEKAARALKDSGVGDDGVRFMSARGVKRSEAEGGGGGDFGASHQRNELQRQVLGEISMDDVPNAPGAKRFRQ